MSEIEADFLDSYWGGDMTIVERCTTKLGDEFCLTPWVIAEGGLEIRYIACKNLVEKLDGFSGKNCTWLKCESEKSFFPDKCYTPRHFRKLVLLRGNAKHIPDDDIEGSDFRKLYEIHKVNKKKFRK